MANRFKPYDQVDVESVISSGKLLGISESSMAFKTLIDDEIAIPYYNVITKFYPIIKKYIEEVSLTEDDFFKYKCRPNYYCYVQYGTPELASSLLYINNMDSATKFKNTKFKRFKNNIMSVINELMSLNEKDLRKNRVSNGLS